MDKAKACTHYLLLLLLLYTIDFLLKHILMNLHLILKMLLLIFFYNSKHFIQYCFFFRYISVNIMYFIICIGFVIDAKIIKISI